MGWKPIPGLRARKNSGTLTAAFRQRLNFIEGSNVTISVADDATDEEIDVTIAASGGGGGGAVPGWIAYLAARQSDETGSANDDFFNDASLDAAWTTLTVSGAQTITENYGKLSVQVTSDLSSGDYNAVLKSVTPSVGDVIETRLSLMTTGNFGAGLVWADGNTSSANMCSFEVSKQSAYDYRIRHLTRTGTFTSYGAAGSIADELEAPIDSIYLRLEYDATNTFRLFCSVDGVSWVDLGTQADTQTPTHVGLFWTTFGLGVESGAVSFDYFRYNA